MKRQTTDKQSLYNQKISSLFTQLICETESLYEKVTNSALQNPQTVKLTTNTNYSHPKTIKLLSSNTKKVIMVNREFSN